MKTVPPCGVLRVVSLIMAAWCAAATAAAVHGQIIEEAAATPTAVRYGQSVATRYKVGARIEAKGGTVQDILVMVAVPLECPEQEVHILEEDVSPHVAEVEYRTLPAEKLAPAGARQMMITIPQLPPRQEAYATITYEVITKAVLPPLETATLRAPTKVERWLKPYLAGSPFINVGHRRIREAVEEALAAKPEEANAEAATAAGGAESSPGDAESGPVDAAAAPEEDAYETVGAGGEETQPAADEAAAETAPAARGPESTADEPAPADAAETAEESAPAERTDWQRVEAIYDYVQKHVTYEEGAEDKSALDALQEGRGDCHGISALFVAMCRTAEVPARMVWVDGHQYAEFYLEDEAGQGAWYPVQSAGSRSFGEMPSPKVILQKGDNFRVPERRRERLRYASDYTLLLSSPKFKPKVTYIREQL